MNTSKLDEQIARLEASNERLEQVLRVGQTRLDALRALRDYGLEVGKVVHDSLGREVRVTSISYKPGYEKPWVWGERRMADVVRRSGPVVVWQDTAKCLMDLWTLPVEVEA